MSSANAVRAPQAPARVTDEGTQSRLHLQSVESDQLARAESALTKMLEADRLLRRDDVAGLRNLGFSTEHIAELKARAIPGDAGYPKYAVNAARRHLRFVRSTLGRGATGS